MASPGAVMAKTSADDINSHAVSPESILGGGAGAGVTAAAAGASIGAGDGGSPAKVQVVAMSTAIHTSVTPTVRNTTDDVMKSSPSSPDIKTNTQLQPTRFPGDSSTRSRIGKRFCQTCHS